jgi:hypothetical protein
LPGYFILIPELTPNQLLTKQNIGKMKKLLLVLAIGAFVACNNSTESTEQKADTTTTAAPADTTAKPADTTAAPADTTAKPVDTLKK